jgi:mRNA-degrading endonuclease RelE of RelBE toxin-antitoxin system
MLIGPHRLWRPIRLSVYKFRSQNQLYLLGYTIDDVVRLVYLEAIGPHENFYRDLKKSP